MQKLLRLNAQKISKILSGVTKDNPVSPENKAKIFALLEENQKLRSSLFPQVDRPNPELQRIEDNYNRSHSSELYCSNCGEPNRYNRMNGKLWCFNCNKPFKGVKSFRAT